VQSRYERTLADLPWHGVSVRLELRVRRFVCLNPECQRAIFAERVPKLAAPYARRTFRFTDTLSAIGLSLGGEAGARTAARLGIQTSPDTLLRVVRATTPTATPTPTVLGVDDWALRRGQHYGTILVDLERHQPIDLLAGRDATTLADWLKQHPGVAVISRDRAGAYADGARQGAPDAVQVADRFHLNKNAREVLEHLLNRQSGVLRQAARNVAPTAPASEVSVPAAHDTIAPDPLAKKRYENRSIAQIARSQEFHRERRAKYEDVQALKKDGYGVNDIRKLLGLHYGTVSRFYYADTYPFIDRAKRGTLVDGFDAYLRERWASGCHDAMQLYQEIRERGYQGSALTLRRYVHAWRKRAPAVVLARSPKPPQPTPRGVAWLMWKAEDKLRQDERRLVEEVLRLSPDVERGLRLANEFRQVFKDRTPDGLTAWMEKVAASGLKEFKDFVTSLRRDEAAVRAAVTSLWSTGQVEGQINRLKVIKRQMFGRAKLDLLKVRVLARSP
jgi:transposase